MFSYFNLTILTVAFVLFHGGFINAQDTENTTVIDTTISSETTESNEATTRIETTAADETTEAERTEQSTTITTTKASDSSNSCNPNPCQNSGLCLINYYNIRRCNCSYPYHGNKCQHKYCKTNKAYSCRNGAFCDASSGEEKCVCTEFYTGPTCEQTVCPKNYCLHNGTCEFDNNSYEPKCKCTDEYTGSNCEIKIPCMLWTKNEQCKTIYGANFTSRQQTYEIDYYEDEYYGGYYYDRYNSSYRAKNMLFDYQCTKISCTHQKHQLYSNVIVYESSSVLNTHSIVPLDGTICDDDRVCINKMCVKAPKHAKKIKTLKEDKPTCEALLKKHGIKTISYCADYQINATCPTMCHALNKLNDKNPMCPFLTSLCHSGSLPVGISSKKIAKECPVACSKTLRCPEKAHGNVCLNGGKCVNKNETTEFLAFECKCEAGFSGLFCETKSLCHSNKCGADSICKPISKLNYGCFPKTNEESS